jgi:outer membrane protein assembly factor BamB
MMETQLTPDEKDIKMRDKAIPHAMSPGKAQRYVSIAGWVATSSAIFAMILCVLIIVNYIQVKRADPLNTIALKAMVERLHSNPGDDLLRQDIRTLDLIARKAFFTSQWQIRMGGYLLFFSLLLVVICMKSVELMQKNIPAMPAGDRPDPWSLRKTNRAWVAYTGMAIVAISLLIVVLTHQELGKTLDVYAQSDQFQPGKAGNAEGATNAGNDIENVHTGVVSSQGDSAANADTSGGSKTMTLDGYPSDAENSRNFPAFRGPGGNGIAFQKNIPTTWDGKSGKNILWKTEIPLPGFNSPIVWNDRVFLSGASENRREVYCVDLKSGKILWQKAVEKVPGSPVQVPKIIRETGYCAPGMTTDGRRVYAIFANGDLISFDLEGNQVWARNLGAPLNHYGHSSSLVMYHDMLIVQYDQRGSGSVMALDGKTGKTVWQTSRNVKISWASPVLVNTGKRWELILAADPMVASYNPANGKELWQMSCISGEVGPSVSFADGVVYSVNDYSKLSAIGIGDPPKLLWEDSDYLSDIPSPLATGKYLFLVTSYGAAACYDAKKGTKNWEHELETPVYASPILAEGRIYVLDKKGVMHILKDEKTYSVIGEPSLGEGSSCTPAFSDGKIIIRGDKNLYCIGK